MALFLIPGNLFSLPIFGSGGLPLALVQFALIQGTYFVSVLFFGSRVPPWPSSNSDSHHD